MTDDFAVRWGAATHTGRLRPENQDAQLTQPPVFLVADGMGGHAHGRAAADTVVRTFADAAWSARVTPYDLQVATAAADRAVRDLAGGSGRAPGSTVTGVAISEQAGEPAWLVFNLGDSRGYLLRDGALTQITVDHSHEQALIDAGAPVDAATTSPHAITRAIGAGLSVEGGPDQWLVPAVTGDRVLLCSDGLTGELTDALVTAILLEHDDPSAAADALVEAALRGGARDNVTAVVVDALVVRRPVSPADWRAGHHDTLDAALLDVEDTLIDDVVADVVADPELVR